ncbi:MAG TPA: esterase, partial [Ruthenibacterium lactatiformans]|nr:esterase [Ruthenibacterium lactatiformans]
RLATDVYVPGNAQGPVPVMLVRTPYDKTAAPWNYFNFVRRGYALAVQDVRGRSASEGDFLPCYHEVEDGDDTLNWLAGQEWSNGRVGMIGG